MPVTETESAPTADAITVDQAAPLLKGIFGDTPETPEGEATEAPVEETNAEVEGAEAPEEEAEETPSSEPPARYAVDIDGEERRVTLDELKRHYATAVKLESRSPEIEKAQRAIEAERQHYAQQLQSFLPALEAAIQDEFGKIDWPKLAEEDPATYVQKFAKYQQRLAVQAQARAEFHAAQERAKAEATEKQTAYLEKQAKLLADKLPIFADEAKATTTKAELKAYLKAEGFSPMEISQLGDHRTAVVAYKAMLYDKAQKAKAVATQKAAKAPPVQKPGTSQKGNISAEREAAASERLKNTGSVEAAAEIFRLRRIAG